MNKFLKFILNGGSAIIYTIIAFNFFVIGTTYGMSFDTAYQFIGYVSVIYLLIQGIQFNMAKVSSIGDAAIDIITSFIPLAFMFYVFITVDLNDTLWVYVRNIMFLTAAIDVFVFGWGSLKILLYTDKNAGNS